MHGIAKATLGALALAQGALAFDNGAPHSRLPVLGWSSWVALGCVLAARHLRRPRARRHPWLLLAASTHRLCLSDRRPGANITRTVRVRLGVWVFRGGGNASCPAWTSRAPPPPPT